MKQCYLLVYGSLQLAFIVVTDTGGGGPLNVQRVVKELIAAGAAGVFLEVHNFFLVLLYYGIYYGYRGTSLWNTFCSSKVRCCDITWVKDGQTTKSGIGLIST